MDIRYQMAIVSTIMQLFLLYDIRGQKGKIESLIRIGGTSCLVLAYVCLLLSNIINIYI